VPKGHRLRKEVAAMQAAGLTPEELKRLKRQRKRDREQRRILERYKKEAEAKVLVWGGWGWGGRGRGRGVAGVKSLLLLFY
jgi:hypothetical protein